MTRLPPGGYPHPFEADADVPADWRGRRWCARCSRPGAAGDDRHPGPPHARYPVTPPEVAELERRRLGEHDDESE